MRKRWKQQETEQYESVFESVGLGASSDDDDDDDDAMEEEKRGDPARMYHGRNKCDGVKDIYLTGSVCALYIRYSFTGLLFALASGRWMRSTGRPGGTSTSSDVSDAGTVSSASFDSRYVSPWLA